jgi:TRAP-type transport system periplasmic protein
MPNKIVAMALAAVMLVVPAHAAEALVFATASPPQGPISTVIFEDWAARINADGAGVVTIDVQHGVVPISWGIMTMVGGRFPLTSVVELPYLTGDAETASVAFWRLYAEGHLDTEYHDIVPLYLTAFPQSGIHLSAPLASLDDLNGARVISGSQTNAAVVQALGGVPQSINPADAYEAIQRGTADGRLVPWTAFPPFRMDEITSYHIEAPVGTVIGMVFISRDVWSGLSEDAREILMRHSGEEQTRKLGQFFDAQDAGIRAGVAASGGHEIVSPSAEQAEQWKARLKPVAAAWLERTEGGSAILERFSALLAEVSGN